MNTFLQQTEKAAEWILAIAFSVVGLLYCLTGVWGRGLLALVLAVLAAPRTGAHSYVRLGSIALGMLIL